MFQGAGARGATARSVKQRRLQTLQLFWKAVLVSLLFPFKREAKGWVCALMLLPKCKVLTYVVLGLS